VWIIMRGLLGCDGVWTTMFNMATFNIVSCNCTFSKLNHSWASLESTASSSIVNKCHHIFLFKEFMSTILWMCAIMVQYYLFFTICTLFFT
jgi:hypothetical protein